METKPQPKPALEPITIEPSSSLRVTIIGLILELKSQDLTEVEAPEKYKNKGRPVKTNFEGCEIIFTGSAYPPFLNIKSRTLAEPTVSTEDRSFVDDLVDQVKDKIEKTIPKPTTIKVNFVGEKNYTIK